MLASLPAEPPTALTPAVLRQWPLPLADEGDKHVRGTVLVIGGSPQTPGAVLLAGVASLRAGAGRIQLATSAAVAPHLAVAVPEALVLGLDGAGSSIDVEQALLMLEPRLARADAVLIGPGLDDGPWVSCLLEGVLAGAGPECIVVVDAAALTAVPAIRAECLAAVAERIVATPNRQEAAALMEGSNGSAMDQAVAVAKRIGGVATVHGEVASSNGGSWTTGTGGIGLGTSGSGDVLAGIVAGLAARCGSAAQAACWGSYLHGAAGDRLTARLGPVGFLARELLLEVPATLAQLSR
jgi:hydroxyethylthiazole kinase-like uncharacterized protein yjeF